MTITSDAVGTRKVAVFHHQLQTRTDLIRAMEELGHNVVCEGSDGKQMVDAVLRNQDIDLVITGNKLSSIDGVSALLDISDRRTIPAIVVTRQRSLEMVERALQDHVMAYLIEPVVADEIKPTIYLVIKRFEQFEELKKEVADLQELLDVRRHIERAKAILMRRNDIGENEAYTRLRKCAMDNRMKILDAAKQILEQDALSTADE